MEGEEADSADAARQAAAGNVVDLLGVPGTADAAHSAVAGIVGARPEVPHSCLDAVSRGRWNEPAGVHPSCGNTVGRIAGSGVEKHNAG